MCADEDGAVVCECLEGFVAAGDISTSCAATAAPTAAPTGAQSPRGAQSTDTTDATPDETNETTDEPETHFHMIKAPAVHIGGSGFLVGGHLTMGAGVDGWITPATLGK
jgi:hypothetical protein